MWSRLTAWILAVLTALVHNMGVWQQSDIAYKGDPGYTIQEDEVDYTSMYAWYNSLYDNSNASCTVESKSHNVDTNVRGVAFIIAGAAMNPDAQMVFSDEDVIVAPGACTVQTDPSTSPNQIIVANDGQGADGFKMVVEKPKRWFCCEDVTPTVTGGFYHKQQSHKINLKQGDTVCVASSDTTVTLYRGDGRDGGLKKCDLRTFLRAADDEVGDSSTNLNGNTEQVLTKDEYKSDALCSANISDDSMYRGPSGWQMGKNGRWYYGKATGTAGKDYAANQYIVYEGMYYTFDSAGYMITGWHDGYYFYEFDDSNSDYKQGAMCFNSIVPKEGSSTEYVYVGYDGKVDTVNNSKDAMESNGRRYVYNKATDSYVLSSSITSENQYGNSAVSGNNNSGQNITPKEQGNAISDSQYDDLLSLGKVPNVNLNGWVTKGSDWLYMQNGNFYQADQRGFTCNDRDAYMINVNDALYFFDEETHLLIKGNSQNQPAVIVTSSVGGDSYVLDGSGGVHCALKNSWWFDGLKWYYAGTDGKLWVGVHTDPDGNTGRYYAFNDDYTLDVETQSVNAHVSGEWMNFVLDGAVVGSRIKQ